MGINKNKKEKWRMALSYRVQRDCVTSLEQTLRFSSFQAEDFKWKPWSVFTIRIRKYVKYVQNNIHSTLNLTQNDIPRTGIYSKHT